MIVQYTSVKEVMGRVIRDVGGKLPSHYTDSMIEWLHEGIMQLETKYQLIEKSTGNRTLPDGVQNPKALITQNHVVPLPQGLHTLIAVEDEFGRRVRTASDITDMTNQSTAFNTTLIGARPTNFQVDVQSHVGTDPAEDGPASSVPFDGSDLIPSEGGSFEWAYKIQGKMLQTSVQCMFVKLHYLSLPLDEEGYIEVPDVEEYKQALTFYTLRQLIGAGFAHPIWNGPPGWNHYNSMWEKYAGRALGVIKYPSQDRMEKLRTSFAERMIPPRHFYSDFFIGGEQTQDINYI